MERCIDVAGTAIESYARSSCVGSLTVDGLTNVWNAQRLITAFNLSFNGLWPIENVLVSGGLSATGRIIPMP